MLKLSSRIVILFGAGIILTIIALLMLGASLGITVAVVICFGIVALAALALVKPGDELITASLRFNDGIDEVPEMVHVGKRSPFSPVAETLGLFGDLVHKQSRTFWTERLEKEAVLESLEEGVIISDGEGRITQLNATASRMLGTHHDEIAGRRLIDLTEKGPFVKRCAELLVATLEGHGAAADAISVDENNVFNVTVTPRAKREGAIVVMRDGSHDHKLEQMGRDFIANASHELRTPITIIKGFAETLRDLPEISEAMLEDITDKIIRNCERMSGLVKSLITLADLDAIAQVEHQKCDLVALADRCKHTLLTVYPDIHLEIVSTEDEIAVHCDPNLIELALMNLLENGVKYSESPARLTVSIEEDEGCVRLSVTDQGKGIPQSDLEHIFDRFYTIDKAHSRKLGGAGLGLSIVKRIVTIHGASISATSNKGTTFTMTFPR